MNDLLLEARDVTKNFGGLQAISQVSFNIRKGEIFSMIGPNGAGKTTLFNLITAFLPPTGGRSFLKEKESPASNLIRSPEDPFPVPFS